MIDTQDIRRSSNRDHTRKVSNSSSESDPPKSTGLSDRNRTSSQSSLVPLDMLEKDPLAADEIQKQIGGLRGSSASCLPGFSEDPLVTTKVPIVTSTAGNARQRYKHPQLTSSIYNPSMKVERQERASKPKQNLKRSRTPSVLVPDHGGNRLKFKPASPATVRQALKPRYGAPFQQEVGSQSSPQMRVRIVGYIWQPLPVEETLQFLPGQQEDLTVYPETASFSYMDTPNNSRLDQESNIDTPFCNPNVPNGNTFCNRQAGEGIIPIQPAHSLPTTSSGMYLFGKVTTDVYKNWG